MVRGLAAMGPGEVVVRVSKSIRTGFSFFGTMSPSIDPFSVPSGTRTVYPVPIFEGGGP